MKRFLNGEFYVVVHPGEWKSFVEMCDEAGLLWSGLNSRVSDFVPAAIQKGRPVRVSVYRSNPNGVRLTWTSVDSVNTRGIPTVGFRRLKPIEAQPNRAVISSNGRSIMVQLLSPSGRTLKQTVADCSPDDEFRFGPGALLALFRALETEEDRMLAMDLIGNERIRQLEPDIPNVRELLGLDSKGGSGMDAIDVVRLLAGALAETFGAAVELAIDESEPGKSHFKMRLVQGESHPGKSAVVKKLFKEGAGK